MLVGSDSGGGDDDASNQRQTRAKVSALSSRQCAATLRGGQAGERQDLTETDHDER